MNNKLSISEVAGLVSRKCGLTKKECEPLLKEAFLLAAETLSSGEPLVMKGIGSFRLVWVNPRGSVDINTGEAITIPGHYKLSYLPDKALREAVNEPFACFTTEVLPPAGESVSGRPEKEEAVALHVSEAQEETVAAEVPEKARAASAGESSPGGELHIAPGEQEQEQGARESAPVPEETAPSVAVADNVAPQQEPAAASGEMPVGEKDGNGTSGVRTATDGGEEAGKKPDGGDAEASAGKPESGTASGNEVEREYRRRTRNGYIAGFVTAALLFLLIGGGVCFFRSHSGNLDITFSIFKFPSAGGGKDAAAVNKTDTAAVVTDGSVAEQRQSETGPGAAAGKEAEAVVETVEPGKFLTTIALKHYGNKIFWVYIYRENEDRIWNPRYLPKGFKVVVPPPSKYGIDSEDEASVRKAQELEKQILYEIE